MLDTPIDESKNKAACGALKRDVFGINGKLGLLEVMRVGVAHKDGANLVFKPVDQEPGMPETIPTFGTTIDFELVTGWEEVSIGRSLTSPV